MGEMLLERKTVSIPRACELVGVSRRTIYNWLAGGKIQYVRTAGGSVRIFEDTLWRDPEAASSESAGASWTQQRLSRGA
jgi:excisionase family DNA binding protein